MTNPSGIIPLDLKVLVRPDPVEQKTAGGVYIPEQAQEKQQYAVMKGTLVAIGANAFKEWGSGVSPKVGSRVVVAQYAGANVKGDDGVSYRLMNDADVCAGLAQ